MAAEASGPGLLAAARDGDLTALRKHLREHPEDVGVSDGHDETPLHWATIRNHPGCVSALLAAGADTARRNIGGFTPLHFAAERGHTDIAVALIAAGANTGAKDKFGATPLDIAAGSSRALLRAMKAAMRDAAPASGTTAKAAEPPADVKDGT